MPAIARVGVDFTITRTTGPNGGAKEMRDRFAKGSGNLTYHFAQRVTSYARINAPVRTGVLKKSIQRTLIAPGTHQVKVGAFYGIYVNYGTRYMHAQPFWEPAIQLATLALRKEMADLLHGNKLDEVPQDDD